MHENEPCIVSETSVSSLGVITCTSDDVCQHQLEKQIGYIILKQSLNGAVKRAHAPVRPKLTQTIWQHFIPVTQEQRNRFSYNAAATYSSGLLTFFKH
jgi:hypothetical protein